MCPEETVLVGVSANVGSLVDGLSGICETLILESAP
jgi:hypothetical protein